MAPPAPVAAGVGFGAGFGDGFGAGFGVGLVDLPGCDFAGGFFFDGDDDWAEQGKVAEVRATAAARRKRRAVGAGIILWGGGSVRGCLPGGGGAMEKRWGVKRG
jgi:hypothetical protein